MVPSQTLGYLFLRLSTLNFRLVLMPLAFALLIAAGLVVFVAAPLLAAETAGGDVLPVDVTPLADLKRRRLVVYENLKDLEFEFQAGKSPGRIMIR